MRRRLPDDLPGALRRAVRRRVRIDARSLALFRVALGSLLLADLLLRSRSLHAFYTDDGVLPRTALLAQHGPTHWSLHLASGEAWGQALLFAVAGVVAVALAVGYRTRLATAVSWLLLVSLHNRVPDVLNGGDVLLRLLLFWGLFLPLGARWSVDARHREPDEEVAGDYVAGVASAALLVQVVALYLTNAAFKLTGDVWVRGDGLRYVFSLGQFTVLLGERLGQFPALLHVLDYVWLVTIALSFALLLLTGWPRALYAVALMGMHLGMVVTMRIDLFPLVSVASLVPFLPAAVWDRAAPLADRRPVRALDRWHRRLADALPVVRVADVPPALSRVASRLSSAVVVVFLVLVVLWNVQFLGAAEVVGHEPVPEEAEPALQVTGTDQYWNMFAPDPLSVDGWVVAPAQLPDGSRVDAYRDGSVDWDRPEDVSSTYPTARWRKYLVGLWRYDTADRRQFAAYLCDRYERRHGVRPRRVTVYFVEQPTVVGVPDDDEPTERERLERHTC
ncbi:HTTM domain-containing protein [Halobacteriales archaeon SW_5_70_135]|nr:MAG: HTTM domain-containing protein [Halobacteriales archaeon SW_5_70_135]